MTKTRPSHTASLREAFSLRKKKSLLKKIRFETFMKDCRSKIMQDNESLYKKIDIEKEKIKAFLDAQYEDIIIIIKFKC